MTSGEKISWGAFSLVVVVIIGGTFAWRMANPQASGAHSIGELLQDPASLPGLLATEGPWDNNLAQLSQRLDAMQFPKTAMEGAAMHIHQQMVIFVNGAQVGIPADIGIGQNFFSPIHVHDTVGIIHVESPVPSTFYLGQVFDVWGVRFTQECIGGFCADEDDTLRVYVNGALQEGDPRAIELRQHDQITVVYGTESEIPAEIPSSYTFPQGY